jgi:DNA-binding LacI/PurR family transcriptional regulator
MSDAIAIGAIRGLRDRGLSIPGDVSVVGFDDIELAQTTDPPLTTVHQPIRGKGEEAARLLLSVITGRGQEAGHRRLPTRLIVRASTASAPGRNGR